MADVNPPDAFSTLTDDQKVSMNMPSDSVMVDMVDDEIQYMGSNQTDDINTAIQRYQRAKHGLRKINNQITKKTEIIEKERELVDADVNERKDFVLANLACQICGEIMFDPYMLHGCGHTFCCGCLESWFKNAKEKYVPDQAEVATRRTTVNNIVAVLQTMNVQLSEKQTWDLIHPRKFAKPIFTCPGCRRAVVLSPMQNKNLMGCVIKEYGPDPVNDRDYPWTKYFRTIFDDMV